MLLSTSSAGSSHGKQSCYLGGEASTADGDDISWVGMGCGWDRRVLIPATVSAKALLSVNKCMGNYCDIDVPFGRALHDSRVVERCVSGFTYTVAHTRNMTSCNPWWTSCLCWTTWIAVDPKYVIASASETVRVCNSRTEIFRE